MNRNRIVAALAALLVMLGAAFASVTTATATPAPDPTVNYTVNYSPLPGSPDTDEFDRAASGTSAVYWATGWQFTRRSICLESGWATAGPYLDRVALDWRAATNNLLILYVRKSIDGCAASGFYPSQRVIFHTYKAQDGNCGYFQPTVSGAYIATAHAYINLQTGGNYDACRTGDEPIHVYTHEFGHALGLAHFPDPEEPSVMNVAYRGRHPQEGPYDGPRAVAIYNNNPK